MAVRMSQPATGNARQAWATNLLYPNRAHMVPNSRRVALCGLPIDRISQHRPQGPLVCPECAIAFVELAFPAIPLDAGAPR